MSNRPINIEELCKKYCEFDSCKLITSEDSLKVEFFSPVKITLHFSLKKDPKKHQILFFIQADRFIFDGDKTDLNEVFGIILSTFLKCSKYYCSVIVRNVSDNIMGLDTEIDYTILIPNQIHPDLDYFQNSRKAVEALDWLITELLLLLNLTWKILGCPCEECKNESKFEDFFSYEIPQDYLNRLIKAKITGKKESHLSRKHPTWDFYCNFSKGISILNSPDLVKLLAELIKRSSQEYLKSDKCIFIKTEFVQNAIPIPVVDSTQKILNSIELTTLPDFKFVPFENAFLALGNDFLLFRSCDVSYNTYRRFKEIISERNIAESRFLFPPSNFKWSPKINPTRFEDMCLELLKRERFTKWARKSGATNEGDNGRDLISEMVEITNITFNESGKHVINSEIRKVVVQCKAYSKSIGKSDVKDIRDTIEFHNSNGYLLIAANGISGQLIKHLELLKEKSNIYINWWTRTEIEDRLKLHQDILFKYSDLVEKIEVSDGKS